MPKKRRGTKKRPRGTSRSLGERAVFLALFVAGAFIVYWQRGDLLQGVKGYLFGTEPVRLVARLQDLSSAGEPVAASIRVRGIPDYAGMVRLPVDGKVKTCFRMTGFQGRLLVCTPKSVERPAEIAEILREHAFQGRLTSLGKDARGEAIRKALEKTHGIRVPADGWLLLDGESPLPSLGKTLALACGAVLSFFFLVRVIL